jgi:hypothetical protein
MQQGSIVLSFAAKFSRYKYILTIVCCAVLGFSCSSPFYFLNVSGQDLNYEECFTISGAANVLDCINRKLSDLHDSYDIGSDEGTFLENLLSQPIESPQEPIVEPLYDTTQEPIVESLYGTIVPETDDILDDEDDPNYGPSNLILPWEDDDPDPPGWFDSILGKGKLQVPAGLPLIPIR